MERNPRILAVGSMIIIFVGMIELSPGSRKIDVPHLIGWTSKSGFVKESTTSHVDT